MAVGFSIKTTLCDAFVALRVVSKVLDRQVLLCGSKVLNPNGPKVTKVDIPNSSGWYSYSQEINLYQFIYLKKIKSNSKGK